MDPTVRPGKKEKELEIVRFYDNNYCLQIVARFVAVIPSRDKNRLRWVIIALTED